MSSPLFALALRMACRSEPAPLSPGVVTVNVCGAARPFRRERQGRHAVGGGVALAIPAHRGKRSRAGRVGEDAEGLPGGRRETIDQGHVERAAQRDLTGHEAIELSAPVPPILTAIVPVFANATQLPIVTSPVPAVLRSVPALVKVGDPQLVELSVRSALRLPDPGGCR